MYYLLIAYITFFIFLATTFISMTFVFSSNVFETGEKTESIYMFLTSISLGTSISVMTSFIESNVSSIIMSIFMVVGTIIHLILIIKGSKDLKKKVPQITKRNKE